MNKNVPDKAMQGRFPLRGLSIQQRLPLLICALLLSVIFSFGFASYYAVRKAAMEVGKERLRTLTNELGSMFSVSTRSLVDSIKKAADNDTIRQCLASGGKELRTEALINLKKLRTDSTVVLVEILDADFKSILSYSEAGENLQTKLSAISGAAVSRSGSDKLGNMYAINNSIYLPVIAAVHNKKQVAGYLVNWRLLTTTPQAIDQVSALMGKGAALYVSNTDGSVWTNLLKPVPHPPIETKNLNTYFEYRDVKGDDAIAATQLIANSNWLVVIEFSKEVMLEGATRFVKWLIVIGGLLIVAGILIAWLMSRNITKPLKQLTRAAMAISQGDYSYPAEINKSDELGKLANAFNTMKKQVQATQSNLEQRIKDRTIQLEIVNNELEAFSYSISHDLRAPLRGVLGFSEMLEDGYSNKLDGEGKRIISIIKANTLKMSELIDALLSFFKMSKQDIVKRDIPTNELVKEVISELDNTDHIITWNMQHLPDIYGDVNSIRQVWINLISNAVKYSRKATNPQIEIGTFNDKGQSVFFVKDNGIGFDAKYKDRLFKVFQRLHNASEFEGTGVGLAIVEKIISKHGGNVFFEAEENNGACFYFSLPAKS